MEIKSSYKTGLSFGITSGVITTLGLLVGLIRATGSAGIAIGGILMIAIADALSDSFGIHLSEESKVRNHKEVWEATASTFIFKFVTALTFLIPIVLFSLERALLVGSLWGIFLLSVLSYKLSKAKGEDYYKSVVEHILVAVVVILLTYFVGGWVGDFIL